MNALPQALRSFDAIMRTDPERAVAALEQPQIQAAFADLAAKSEKKVIVLRKLDHFLEVRGGRVIVHCMKCESALQSDQVTAPRFRYQFIKPPRIMIWDIARARQLVATSGRKPEPIAPHVIETWFARRSNLTPGHLLHIPRQQWEEPVLVDVVMAHAYVGPQRTPAVVPSLTLIDGHHRAALSAREGFPLMGFLMTPAEHLEVATIEEGAYDPELMGWRTLDEVEQMETILDVT